MGGTRAPLTWAGVGREGSGLRPTLGPHSWGLPSSPTSLSTQMLWIVLQLETQAPSRKQDRVGLGKQASCPTYSLTIHRAGPENLLHRRKERGCGKARCGDHTGSGPSALAPRRKRNQTDLAGASLPAKVSMPLGSAECTHKKEGHFHIPLRWYHTSTPS